MRLDRPGLGEDTVRFPVGLEEGSDGFVWAHALTLPGCAAKGEGPEQALEHFSVELAHWLGFLASIGEPVPDQEAELSLTVDEWLATGAPAGNDPGVSLFDADLAPFEPGEVQRHLQRLGSLRGRSLPLIRRLREADLERPGPGGYSAKDVADELARAQWWTLTRLGASPLAEVPERTVARLDTAMALAVSRLTELDLTSTGVVELDGEAWTPRKVLRRLLWLEWTLGGTLQRLLDPGAGAHPSGPTGDRGLVSISDPAPTTRSQPDSQ